MGFRGRLGIRSPTSLAMVCALCCCICRVPGVTGTMEVTVAAAAAAVGDGALRDSGSVMLFPTDPGAQQDGASEGATVAPAAEHEDDNSPGYTGTAALPLFHSQDQLPGALGLALVCCFHFFPSRLPEYINLNRSLSFHSPSAFLSVNLPLRFSLTH